MQYSFILEIIKRSDWMKWYFFRQFVVENVLLWHAGLKVLKQTSFFLQRDGVIIPQTFTAGSDSPCSSIGKCCFEPIEEIGYYGGAFCRILENFATFISMISRAFKHIFRRLTATLVIYHLFYVFQIWHKLTTYRMSTTKRFVDAGQTLFIIRITYPTK